jgi:hypothetical protein
MRSGMYGMYALQESVHRRGAPPLAQIRGAKISVRHGVGGMFAASGMIIMSNEPPWHRPSRRAAVSGLACLTAGATQNATPTAKPDQGQPAVRRQFPVMSPELPLSALIQFPLFPAW